MNLFLLGVIAGCLSPILGIWAIRAIKQLPSAIVDYIVAVRGILSANIK